MRERLLGGPPPAVEDPQRTVAFVPIKEYLDLARIVNAMRKAQRAYFEARRKAPYANLDRQYREARDAEQRVDSAIADALARDRQTIPGMEGGEAG